APASSGLVTFSPRLSTDTESPFLFSAAATLSASSTSVPATKRAATFCPSEDRSANERTPRLSESEIKRDLSSTADPETEMSQSAQTRTWIQMILYHNPAARFTADRTSPQLVREFRARLVPSATS